MFDSIEPSKGDFSVLTEVLEEDTNRINDTYELLLDLLQGLSPESKLLFQDAHNDLLKAKELLAQVSEQVYEVNFKLHGNTDYLWEADDDD